MINPAVNIFFPYKKQMVSYSTFGGGGGWEEEGGDMPKNMSVFNRF